MIKVDTTEINKLEEYLKANGIEYTRSEESVVFGYGFYQIIVYENGERIWDAVCGQGTYGVEEGLLEVMGEPVVKPSDHDSVRGWLTADDVIARWTEYRNNGRCWI